MQPISPSLARAAQRTGPVPAQPPSRWRDAADDIAFLMLGSSLIWMLAALVFMILR